MERLDLKSVLPLDFPLSLDIEATNACNLRCIMCPRDKSSKEVGYMDFEMFKKIIDECSGKGVRKIFLHKDGESLLHPMLPEFVRYAKDAKAAEILSVTTNGTLLNQELAERLLEAGLDEVSISIDAATPETSKKIKGRPMYETVERNLVNLFRMNKTFPNISVRFIRMRENEKEELEFYRKWEPITQVMGSHCWDWGGSVEDLSVNGMKTLDLPCELLWRSMAINWDGRVSICCVDWDCQGIIGDVREESLHEIWHGPALRKIREIHLDLKANTLPACANCTYRDVENCREVGIWLLNNKESLLKA
jgi:radical SAM protein with 4Fe4S-binding SPASM domain